MTELLIVGDLTVDRFADGRTAPGGSVLHAGVAAADDGVRPTFLTVAGQEPEARDGLRRLDEIGEVVARTAANTAAYRHGESPDGRRVLTYDAPAPPIDATLAARAASPDVALLAPIADELTATSVAELLGLLRPPCTVMLIQGWLRRLELGMPVHPLPLDLVAEPLWATFGRADAVVLSTEDLAESPEDPFAQAAAVRKRIGPSPVLVLTLGPEGYLLDDPSLDRVVATMPRRVVLGVPAVGAGDTFGAVLALRLAGGAPPAEAAQAATDAVIRLLERRSRVGG